VSFIHMEKNRVDLDTSVPVVLVPGLLCSARLYHHQIAELWQYGPIQIADHTHGSTMSQIARDILFNAPPRFALVGLSMGGYIAFEMMRQAPERVAKLALLDTGARSDTPDQSQRRRTLMALANSHPIEEIADRLFPVLVHRAHHEDERLQMLVRRMARETGPEVFMRQQTAIMNRPDSRPGLGAIGCPTLVVVGDGDALTPPALSEEIAAGIRNADLCIVPHCGHLSTLEQPDTVTQRLVSWLKTG
jgi:pimeloyl-ACP methyl ester carboxylesterase